MIKKSRKFWLISTILLFGILTLINCTIPKCDGEDPPLQCLLFKEYPEMNDQIACQLCAVAIESGNYPDKSHQFCNDPEGILRNCEIISFTYLLTAQRFSEALDLQYEIFYREPFGHDQRVSTILKKHNVREGIISWLENTIDDTKTQTYLARSIANLYLDDISESDNQLQHYISLKGGILDKQTIKLKCRIFQKQGQFNEAFNALSKYISEGQKDQRNYNMLEPYLYHLKGNLLMHHLKFNEAIFEFTKASNTFKSYYQEASFLRGFKFSQFNIGLCYQKMSKHQEAINKYMQLAKNHVKTVQVLNALGNAFIELALQENKEQPDKEKIRKAVFYLNRAIEQNSQYYLAHYNLGYAYMKSNQYELAIQKFKDSLNIQKTSQASYALLTTYFLLGNCDEAQNLITKNMTINKETVDDVLSICYQYGNIKQNPKFYHKIIIEFEPLIKSANGHYWKAMIEFDREQYGLAIDHFLQAYDKGYNEAHLLFNLAYSYELIDDFSLACEYYAKAYQKDPRPQTKQKIDECKAKSKPQTTKQNQEL